MLKKDPDERISLFDLQHHPWLCDYQHANKQMWEETSNEISSNGSIVEVQDKEELKVEEKEDKSDASESDEKLYDEMENKRRVVTTTKKP